VTVDVSDRAFLPCRIATRAAFRPAVDVRADSGKSRPSRIGLKDLARALGVSIGTVERGLNGKPNVSPATRARILALAKEVGYTPNLAARFLKSRRPLRISVHLPAQVALFWDAVREGIREAAAPFAPTLELEFRTCRRLGDGDVPLLERALDDDTDGIILAPGDVTAIAPLLAEAAGRGIPVVCVVTDAPASPRLLSVSADSFTVGAVAGELLARFLPGRGEVGIFTGWLAMPDHADRLRGFATSLAAVNPALKLGPIVEAHDDESGSQRRTRDVLQSRPKLRGFYIGTSTALPVLRAAEREGRLGGLSVVATDLSPELVDWIRAGKIAATVDQRPQAQGHVALRSLHQFLLNPQQPPAAQRIVPHVVMGSTLDLVLQRRVAGRDRLPA
jgi:LacI family transcriptional regulator